MRCQPNNISSERGSRKRPVKIDHHFSDSLFRGRYAPLVGRRQSKLAQDGRLHTGPIEEFALNCRRGNSLPAHHFHEELIVFVFARCLTVPMATPAPSRNCSSAAASRERSHLKLGQSGFCQFHSMSDSETSIAHYT